MERNLSYRDVLINGSTSPFPALPSTQPIIRTSHADQRRNRSLRNSSQSPGPGRSLLTENLRGPRVRFHSRPEVIGDTQFRNGDEFREGFGAQFVFSQMPEDRLGGDELGGPFIRPTDSGVDVAAPIQRRLAPPRTRCAQFVIDQPNISPAIENTFDRTVREALHAEAVDVESRPTSESDLGHAETTLSQINPPAHSSNRAPFFVLASSISQRRLDGGVKGSPQQLPTATEPISTDSLPISGDNNPAGQSTASQGLTETRNTSSQERKRVTDLFGQTLLSMFGPRSSTQSESSSKQSEQSGSSESSLLPHLRGRQKQRKRPATTESLSPASSQKSASDGTSDRHSALSPMDTFEKTMKDAKTQMQLAVSEVVKDFRRQMTEYQTTPLAAFTFSEYISRDACLRELENRIENLDGDSMEDDYARASNAVRQYAEQLTPRQSLECASGKSLSSAQAAFELVSSNSPLAPAKSAQKVLGKENVNVVDIHTEGQDEEEQQQPQARHVLGWLPRLPHCLRPGRLGGM